MSDDTMTSDTTESGNLTVTDAASAIEGMLSAPEDSTEEQPEVVEEQTEEVEEVEDELKKSYQLGSDYTKKTQEVAEQRKVIEQEAKAIIEARQVRDEYSSKLQAVEQFLLSSNDTPEDLSAMKENDPIGYSVKVAEMTEKKEQIQAVQAERQRLAQKQQSDRAAQLEQFVQEEAQKLTVSLPEFSDKAKGEQVRNDIRSYGKKVGFTDEELSQVYDSRHVLVLHKAAQYVRQINGR
jgi:hypothetical protein